MIISDHVIERWAERVHNITKDSLQDYINSNIAKLDNEIRAAFDGAYYLMRGTIPNEYGDKHYYLNKQYRILFILSPDKSKIITCYKIYFPFMEPIAEVIINDSLNEIIKRQAKIRELEREIAEFAKPLIYSERLSIKRRIV